MNRLELIKKALLNTKHKPHTELSYIASNGGQYIDTGITTTSTLKVEIKFNPYETAKMLFGARSSSASYNSAYAVLLQSNSPYFLWNAGLYTPSATVSINTDHTIIIQQPNIYFDNSLIYSIIPFATFEGIYTIKLFACDNGASGIDSRRFVGRIYYFKIWDNDVLVRDFVPVIKNGAVCWFDKVSNDYFYNQGTGNFIAGY